LFHGRRNDGVENGRLFACIVRMLDANADIDDIATCIDRIRQRGDTEQCRNLDRLLLERIAGFDSARKELEAVHDKLQDSLQELLNPPFFPARFLGSVTTPAGEYAKVSHDGIHRVVAFAHEISSGDLCVGDEVYLCHERNAVIAKANSRREIGETAALVRRTEDGRLILSDRDTEVVVSASEKLAVESLQPGDLMLWDRYAQIALNRLEQSARLGYEDIDDTPPQQLGGLDQMRESVLARFVFGILYPDLAREYHVANDGARRLLLHGPPGTGKTTLMRIIAARIALETKQNCRVVTISGAELYSSYVGETERNIRRCFAALNDYDGPGIAFFDEIDAIGRLRGNVSGFHDDRFLGTLLAELEGIHRNNVAVIAATNRADTLDPALRSRFSWEIEMPKPNMTAAGQIFSIHMPEDLPYRPNSGEAPTTRQALIDAGVSRLYEPNSDNMIASLQFCDGKRREVAARELVSGRLIEQICGAARTAAFERQCRGGESGVSVEDMQTAAADAVVRLRKTLTTRNVKSFLPDLPPDLDVVSVEAIQARVDPARYAR
jgi:ATP-dependent 26S proteasome regulatory subunit